MFDPESVIRRAAATCENKHECILMISGFLLGMLAEVTGKTFDPDDPNDWPKRLVAEMRRVDALQDPPTAMTEWFWCAGKTLVEMHRIHGLTAPS